MSDEYELFCPEIKGECIGADCAYYSDLSFNDCPCTKAEICHQLADSIKATADYPGIFELLKRIIRNHYHRCRK